MDSLLETSSSPEPTSKHQLTPIPKPKSSLEVVPESGHRRLSRTVARPPEAEPLPCPRCDSPNTKFCYYNNYNLSQPRHFCRSCRRYWTRGGALRKVPVGGGTRKSSSSNKRKRTATTTTTTSNNSNLLVSCSRDNDAMVRTEYTDPVVSNPDPGMGFGSAVKLNEADVATSECSSICWWGSGQMGSGLLLPFDGYEFGFGSGGEVLGWPLEQVSGGDDGGAVAESGGGAGGAAEGDCFSLPELAISTPAKALK